MTFTVPSKVPQAPGHIALRELHQRAVEVLIGHQLVDHGRVGEDGPGGTERAGAGEVAGDVDDGLLGEVRGAGHGGIL